MTTSDHAAAARGASIPVITSVQSIAQASRAWIVDIWGVIHNGARLFPDAVAACKAFRAAGGIVVLVTNAPRPTAAIEQQLETMGVPDGTYDAIVTSGDVTRGLIRNHVGQPIYHLGPERDVSVFDGIDVRFANAEDAVAVVNTGLFDDITETPDDYAAMLAGFHARNLPMICANPDITVERGDDLVYCAGALAQAYQAMGGVVAYAGKPHPPIYEAAFAHMDTVARASVPRDQIVCIGDGLRTDMKGAATMGLRAVFVPSGVDMGKGGQATQAEIDAAFADGAFKPEAAQFGLRW
ncbi:MAG: TIGR01459 family HAD-type hydrolase [Pseudomonadota bacterium]